MHRSGRQFVAPVRASPVSLRRSGDHRQAPRARKGHRSHTVRSPELLDRVDPAVLVKRHAGRTGSTIGKLIARSSPDRHEVGDPVGRLPAATIEKDAEQNRWMPNARRPAGSSRARGVVSASATRVKQHRQVSRSKKRSVTGKMAKSPSSRRIRVIGIRPRAIVFSRYGIIPPSPPGRRNVRDRPMR